MSVTDYSIRHLLRPSPFFQQLPWGICEALVASMEMEFLAQDELLVFRDETGLDECYVLLRGVMQYSDAMVSHAYQGRSTFLPLIYNCPPTLLCSAVTLPHRSASAASEGQ